MKILYGTTNQAKLESMRRITKTLGIEIIGLNDLKNIPEFAKVQFPKIDETGNNPLENAIIKAKAYYNVFKIPVFSCDCGLYFEGVEDRHQPGTHVRRVNGKELTDSQMIEHYAGVAKKYGGKLTANYKNAICLVMDEQNIFSKMDKTLEVQPFYLVDKSHSVVVKGFPLDSLSVDIATGKYYQDMEDNLAVDKDIIENGFTDFFAEVLNKYKFEKN